MAVKTDLKETLTAYRLHFYDDLALVRAVVDYLDANPDLYAEGDLAEIVSLNQKRPDALRRAPALLAEYVARVEPGFVPANPSTEPLAKALLKERLQLYLDGGCMPYDVCNLV